MANPKIRRHVTITVKMPCSYATEFIELDCDHLDVMEGHLQVWDEGKHSTATGELAGMKNYRAWPLWRVIEWEAKTFVGQHSSL